MRSPETDILLATMIRALKAYAVARANNEDARHLYDEFRQAKRRIYELWPEDKAKLLCRMAVSKAGWSSRKVINLD